jgi:hypothetical protein
MLLIILLMVLKTPLAIPSRYIINIGLSLSFKTVVRSITLIVRRDKSKL